MKRLIKNTVFSGFVMAWRLDLADEDLAVLGEGHHGRRQAAAFLDRPGSSGDQALEPPGDLRLGLHADDAIHLAAVLEHQQRGDASHREAAGRRRVLVDVQLRHADPPGQLGGQLVEHGGAYAVVDGIFTLVAAARGRTGAGEQPRSVLVAEGIVSLAAGIVAFLWPGLTALALVYLIAAWALITGVLAIVAAVRLSREIENEWWLGLSGGLSIVFGVLLMLAPGVGALALIFWIGAYAIVSVRFVHGL